MFMAASAWEAAMQRRGGVCHPGPGPGFTDKQGQYLALIDAYTRVHGRPPSEADLPAPFRGDAAQRAPDGAHAGAGRPDPAPAEGGAQHPGAGRPRAPAPPPPTPNRHNLCAKELASTPTSKPPWSNGKRLPKGRACSGQANEIRNAPDRRTSPTVSCYKNSAYAHVQNRSWLQSGASG